MAQPYSLESIKFYLFSPNIIISFLQCNFFRPFFPPINSDGVEKITKITVQACDRKTACNETFLKNLIFRIFMFGIQNDNFIKMKICVANQPYFFTIHYYLLLQKILNASLVKSEE